MKAEKPVRCGCGGKAVAIGDADNNIYFVKCDKCWISTDLFHSKAEAIKVWNQAMSAKDINVPNKYEYHIDHTDCIWYWNGKSRCPSTCSQYRDGWNDAMNYIYKDGKGYSPYRRGK